MQSNKHHNNSIFGINISFRTIKQWVHFKFSQAGGDLPTMPTAGKPAGTRLWSPLPVGVPQLPST
ncbi:MAG: hypothetical protein KF746_10670 [Chitinophagaceae bacterium]|nr:hypothetical protein [Chitinophagaceae bacterium]